MYFTSNNDNTLCTLSAATNALVLSALCLTGSLATAETNSLRLDVSGHVAVDCNIDTREHSDVIDLGLLSLKARSETVKSSLLFNINCNAPFDYALTSLHGQLVHDNNVTIAAGSDAFTRVIPYTVELSLELDDAGQSIQVGNTCNSQSIQFSNGCMSGSSGSLIAINKTGRLDVSIESSADQRLLSGNYTDSLQLTVRPRH